MWNARAVVKARASGSGTFQQGVSDSGWRLPRVCCWVFAWPVKEQGFLKTASGNSISQMRQCLPSEAIINSEFWNIRSEGEDFTEASNGTWAGNGKTLSELFTSHNGARCHFCFICPSVWLFHPFQPWNSWEPESESQWSASMWAHVRLCLWWFWAGLFDLLLYGALGLQHAGQELWISAVTGDSPAGDSDGSFQLWLPWLPELPCSRRGRCCSASLAWDLKASASLRPLRCRGENSEPLFFHFLRLFGYVTLHLLTPCKGLSLPAVHTQSHFQSPVIGPLLWNITAKSFFQM